MNLFLGMVICVRKRNFECRFQMKLPPNMAFIRIWSTYLGKNLDHFTRKRLTVYFIGREISVTWYGPDYTHTFCILCCRPHWTTTLWKVSANTSQHVALQNLHNLKPYLHNAAKYTNETLVFTILSLFTNKCSTSTITIVEKGCENIFMPYRYSKMFLQPLSIWFYL